MGELSLDELSLGELSCNRLGGSAIGRAIFDGLRRWSQRRLIGSLVVRCDVDAHRDDADQQQYDDSEGHDHDACENKGTLQEEIISKKRQFKLLQEEIISKKDNFNL